jgi:hypothetical protein
MFPDKTDRDIDQFRNPRELKLILEKPAKVAIISS